MRKLITLVITSCLAVASAFAQASLSPVPMIQFFDASSGVALPCVNCTLSTFIAGTSTPAHTYVDSTGTTTNPVVITLNSLGLTTSGVWLAASCYKFILENASAATIWSQDQVCGSSTAGGTVTFAGLTVSGNAAVGGTLAVTGTSTLGVVNAAGITTTAITGYEISPIFNCNVAGLSGSAKCFQNSDGSFTVDYHGNIAGQSIVVNGTFNSGITSAGVATLYQANIANGLFVNPGGAGIGAYLTGPVVLTPETYVNSAACGSGSKGNLATITDSTVNTWGSAITTGGGSDIVFAFCNGTNYTVAAK